MKFFLLMMLTVVVGKASPEPEADPQYYNKGYATSPHGYQYQRAYGPQYPAYGKPGYHGYKSEYPAYYCDPKATPNCAHNSNSSYCLIDSEYPQQAIQYAIEYDPLVLKKYADVADQSADILVDGVTSLEESHFDYSHYNGNAFDRGNWVGGEGYICPSQVLYARPVRAKNVEGEWRVIVQNVAYYTQTERVETCLFLGASCRTLASCYHSKCVQKYVYRRLLSFDPCDAYKGLFIDTYKLPSACSCHIPTVHH